jgi:sarcosine oxidase subunit beta
VRLSLLSREKLLRFEDELGVDSGYRQYGYLFLARTDGEMNELRRAQKVQHACGVSEARMIDAREAKRINPAIGDDEIIGAAYCPTDGFIRAMQILRGYAEGAKRLGVRFEFGREIRELDRGVTYVNAAGAWAGLMCRVPVTQLRRRVLCTVPTHILPDTMPMTIWAGDGFHFRVRDGRVLLLWPDQPPNDDVWAEQVLRFTRERIPILREVPIDEASCWSGLYEMSPDKHAIVGRDPEIENLYLANGSSGHGVMHAPAIGQLVAELIVDGTTSIDLSPLRPTRFAEGDLTIGSTLL